MPGTLHLLAQRSASKSKLSGSAVENLLKVQGTEGLSTAVTLRMRRSHAVLDPVLVFCNRIFGEQRNHEVKRFDLPAYALDVHFFLPQNLGWVLHDVFLSF